MDYITKFKIINCIDNLYETQDEVIILLSENKRLCVSNNSGSGKTTIMMLIILKDICDYEVLYATNKNNNSLIDNYRSIIFVNNKILCEQIYDLFKNVLGDKHSDVLINLCNYNIENTYKNNKNKMIYITTPGRFITLLHKNKVPTKYGVIYVDEIDQTLDIKSDNIENIEENDLEYVLEKIDSLYYLFTCSNMNLEPFDEYDKNLRNNLTQYLQNKDFTIKIYNDKKVAYVTSLVKTYRENFDDFILDIYSQTKKRINDKIIVFLNSIKECEEFYKRYMDPKFPNRFLMIHGKLEPDVRKQTIDNFREYGDILFSTDFLERGLDIKTITVIIHIEFPKSYFVYLNRSGRSLRDHSNSATTSKVFLLTKLRNIDNEKLEKYKFDQIIQ
jgi:superfamily II DNA/RNA helicase